MTKKGARMFGRMVHAPDGSTKFIQYGTKDKVGVGGVERFGKVIRPSTCFALYYAFSLFSHFKLFFFIIFLPTTTSFYSFFFLPSSSPSSLTSLPSTPLFSLQYIMSIDRRKLNEILLSGGCFMGGMVFHGGYGVSWGVWCFMGGMVFHGGYGVSWEVWCFMGGMVFHGGYGVSWGI